MKRKKFGLVYEIQLVDSPEKHLANKKLDSIEDVKLEVAKLQEDDECRPLFIVNTLKQSFIIFEPEYVITDRHLAFCKHVNLLDSDFNIYNNPNPPIFWKLLN